MIRRSTLLLRCLVLIVVLGIAFAGCGGGGTGTNTGTQGIVTGNTVTSSGSEMQEEITPITISVYIGMQGGTPPTPDNKILKLIQDKLGVTFKFDFLVGDSKQKAGVMIAGGDYPDLLGINGGEGQPFIDAGALVPLNDLIAQNAPNLKKHYDPVWNRIIDPKDKKLYIMPAFGVLSGTYYETEHWGSSFWIQKAVLKEFGYPEVRTLNQYFDLIKQYRDKYPTIDGKPTIGFEVLTDPAKNWCLVNPPILLSGHIDDAFVVENNEVKLFVDSDDAKRYYKKLNDMYLLGLVDKVGFVSNYDQYIAKLSSGTVLGLYDQRWNFNAANISLQQQKKDDRTYAPCPITYDKNTKDWYMSKRALNVGQGYAVSTKCKDPVRVIKVLDTLMTEEWQKILQWGIKDEAYNTGNDGKFYRTPEQRQQQNDPQWKNSNTVMNSLMLFMPRLEGSYEDGNATNPGSQPSEYFDSLQPSDQELLRAYNLQTFAQFFSTPEENPIYYPVWQIAIPAGSPASVALQKVSQLQLKYLPRSILADQGKFETVWDEFKNEIAKVDTKAYLDVYNTGIQDIIKRVGN